MATHFDSIGFTADDSAQTMGLVERAKAVGRMSVAPGGETIWLWVGPISGAALMVAADPDGTMRCAKPTFRPTQTPTRNLLRVLSVMTNASCPHCDVLVLETKSGTPVAVEVDTIALHRPLLVRGSTVDVSITAFAENFESWDDEEAFTREYPEWSPTSFVPAGMFNQVQGTESGREARALFHGQVTTATTMRNELEHRAFWRVGVRTHDNLEVDVVVDPDTAQRHAPPGAGSIVRVTGWLICSVQNDESATSDRARMVSAGRPPSTARVPAHVVASVPRDWTSRESIDLVGPLSEASVVFESQELPDGVDVERLATESLPSLESIPGFREIAFGPCEVFGGDAGFRRVFSSVGPTRDLLQTQHYGVVGNIGYTATSTCTTLEAEKAESLLLQMMQSLRVAQRGNDPFAATRPTRRRRPKMRWSRAGQTVLVGGGLHAVAPEGWDIRFGLTVIAPDFEANVIVRTVGLPIGFDPEQFAEAQWQAVMSDERFQGLTVQDRRAFGREGARRQEYRQVHNGTDLVHIQDCFGSGGRGYRATATVTLDSLPRLRNTVIQILDDLRIRPANP